MMTTETPSPAGDFIQDIIDAEIREGLISSTVATRFPPEPNGYLHIGHAKSICLNFGLARKYGGTCNLRLDDTDPEGETQEYVDSIIADVKWLGFDWGERLYYASDYYEQLYLEAVALIKMGKAYVCDLGADAMREYRGTLTEPGLPSPYRNRTVEENLSLFARMHAGEFPEGHCVLRAKIDMSSPNILLRDPVLFRIKKKPHYHRGHTWCIYPMYDFAHCLSDAIEGITHSICTLEFENNRPLYDWILQALRTGPRPRQIEFARLNLSYTVLSKRKLISLVEGGYVSGWDDPRLPTLSGLRRRGYTPESIRNFCERIGVAKKDSLIDIALLEQCLREDLEPRATRALAVLRPLKVVIENYPEGQEEVFPCPRHPRNPELGSRMVPFGREIYIERDDFMVNPGPGFLRLAPGREVRLRYGYFIKCTDFRQDEKTGEIIEVRCQYDPATRNGFAPDGRKPKATLHWVAAAFACDARVRLYDRLFCCPEPLAKEGDFLTHLNPASLVVLDNCKIEPSLGFPYPTGPIQFERQGFFILDQKESRPELPVFNRAVGLRNLWTEA
jgi:glutaminyl-tRNA synthetase